jgi:hypothetical protein
MSCCTQSAIHEYLHSSRLVVHLIDVSGVHGDGIMAWLSTQQHRLESAVPPATLQAMHIMQQEILACIGFMPVTSQVGSNLVLAAPILAYVLAPRARGRQMKRTGVYAVLIHLKLVFVHVLMMQLMEATAANTWQYATCASWGLQAQRGKR